MNKIPTLEEQSKEILDEKVKVFEFYIEDKKEWIEAESPKWQAAVMEKFSWIKQMHTNCAPGEELEPRDYALLNDDDKINIRDFNNIKNKADHLRRHISRQNTGDVMTSLTKTTVIEDYPRTFTWRDLFFKLCFE